jgi:chemotaxis signal transduction protein
MMHDKSGGQRNPPVYNKAADESLLHGEPDGIEANPSQNVQLLRTGSLQLGIFQNEIATIVAWREPAPLPYAPASVLGVVSIQGRMLTVLDLASLLSPEASSSDKVYQHILALRGDEQLALAVDALGETIAISDGNVERADGLFLRVYQPGNRQINILNTKELFATALHGRERRRRRF